MSGSDNTNKDSNFTVEISGMLNALISILITIILFYVTLGPGGATSQLAKANTFFSNACIPTADGSTGFQEGAFLGGIQECDPKNNNNNKSELNKVFNRSSSANFSGKSIKLGRMVIFIGILSNILYIFVPYISLIPQAIGSGFFQKIKSDLCEIPFLNKLGWFCNGQNGGGGIEGDSHGGGVPGFEWLTVLDDYAQMVGGDNCNRSDSIRLFIGFTHIIIFLIFGSLIKGDPLSIAPGLFTIFLSILILFTVFSRLTPESGQKQIYYAIGGIVSFIGWVILFYVNIKSNNPLKISNVIKYSLFIISIACFAYFTGKKDEKSTSGSSISCFVNNFFNALNGSIALGSIKVIIISCALLFTPNNENSVKKTIKNLYSPTGRSGIFFLISVIFILVWDFFPLLKWFIYTENNKPDKTTLFKEGAKNIFLQNCQYNKTAAVTDPSNCVGKNS